ncbi:YceI family protein [Kribbella sp. NPDC004875]|uniref:YceI family protein n=1 Tax=Kribbella sp. NPDC004875 TaxID=3364107 RepID=UPI0036B4C53B
MTKLAELQGEHELDGERTRIGFLAAHRVGSKVRGRFAEFDGAVRLDSADPAASSAWLTVRTDSVDTGDRRRDAQLRKDFFGAAAYPVMTFVSTDVAQVSARRYDVTGELTIRGTTRAVTVPFELTEAGRFTAALTVDRHDWNVNWNLFTTALVRADVVLELDAAVNL